MKDSYRLSSVLSETLGDLGILPKAKKYQVFSLWPAIVGDIAKYAKPRRLSGEVLFVATASSVWSQELYFMRDSIMTKINSALGADQIKEIKFSEHMWSTTEGDTPTDTGPAWSSSADGEGSFQIKGIPDPRLAAAFRRLMRTMARRRQLLLSRGYKLCPVCGSAYPKDREECPACRLRDEFAALGRAIAILDKRPQTSDRELSALIGPHYPYLWERARREVESRLHSYIRYRLAAQAREAGEEGQSRKRTKAKDDLRAEAIEAIKRLASLVSQAPYELLDDAAVEEAVGRRFAALAKKG